MGCNCWHIVDVSVSQTADGCQKEIPDGFCFRDGAGHLSAQRMAQTVIQADADLIFCGAYIEIDPLGSITVSGRSRFCVFACPAGTPTVCYVSRFLFDFGKTGLNALCNGNNNDSFPISAEGVHSASG